ncbi:hypothetical protein [Pseudorhodobacter antarcticus]|uniref:hypothetical protein n=1 Tax=Pseudorhodobacter antarcticus TaxID=1077947 RepID=UPI000B209436|nr:hypothetical protein [Pseudorhodobacter antarcticus]
MVYEEGVRRVLKSLAKVVSRWICLVLAASLLAALVNADPSFKRAEATNFVASHSVLLQTLQTKHGAVRPQTLDKHDEHPVDVHPAVESASFARNYVKAARFRFSGRLNPVSQNIGWQARAPPFSFMPVTS